MAIEMQVSDVLDKLVKLLNDVVVLYPRLRIEVEVAVSELIKYKFSLRDEAYVSKMDRAIVDWEVRLLRVVYMVEDIVDPFLFQLELQRRKGFLRKLSIVGMAWSQYKLANEMKKVVLEARSFSEDLKGTIHPQSEAKEIGDGSPTAAASYSNGWGRTPTQQWSKVSSFTDGEEDAVGLSEEVKSLAAQLLDGGEALRVISVVGMTGSGKTTLVRVVCDSVEIKQHFAIRAWVHVSKEFSLEYSTVSSRIGYLINQVMGMEMDEGVSNEDLIQRLCDFLESKRYLIVLDDVWKTSVWEDIGHAFPDSENGSRVILTTHNKEIALRASQKLSSIIQLHRLSYEDSWTLFLRKARITEDEFNSSELISLKDEILRKCDGSPPAIFILGELFSAKELSHSEWSRVIEEATFASQDQSTISGIFALSYQDLPSLLKPCFLYLGLFPRLFEIPIRRLFRLWIAEGLVKQGPSSTELTPEDLAEDYFQELVSRNLIEVAKCRSDGRAKTCRIPGIWYDVFSSKSMDIGRFYVHPNSVFTSGKPLPYNVRRLAEYRDIKNYPCSDSHVQHLRSYISFNTKKRDTPTEEVATLLNKVTAKRGFGLLRVIDLEGVYKPLLPETIGKLLQLRYLGLRWTFLDSLPSSVGDLPYLETLDVKHTNITNLPDSIWKARNLRHLYMNEIHLDMSIHRPTGRSLANLQTLWGLFVDVTCPMVNGLRMLIHLRKLGLTCQSTSLETVVDSFSQLTNLQSLRLRSVDEYGKPSKLTLGTIRQHRMLTDLYLLGVLPRAFNVRELPQNLEILTLSLSQLVHDPMPILGQLLRLSILRLFGRSYLGKEMTCPSEGFPSLRMLKVWKLEKVEALFVEEDAMPRLRELEIRCCDRMKTVNGLEGVTSLKELTLTNMPEDIVTNLTESLGNKVFIKENKWAFSSPS
ncbi:Disease resistance protein [Quillaja saponaria]|uniref:Disease resistance protein n=1 Tax=Quillaja saponaria TaxID=32244 RepID=A0AAD7LSC7_QUISA|nr:Disease resistance protein [Quillaja saponaria]